MSSKQQTVAAALTDWINACPIEPKISNLKELSDGVVIAKVLLDIDPYYFKTAAASSEGGGGAPPGAHWVLRFQKLKKLHKELTRYYTEALGHRLPSAAPNLTMIAKDSNVEESIKLVKIIVAAAVQSDRREDYIKYIQDLSPISQTELMGVINQMMEIDAAEKIRVEGPGPEQSKTEETDMDQFRMEEEMARLVAEKEAVEAKNRALEKRLGSLQSDFDENQSHLLVLQDQLSSGAVDQGYANRTDPMMRSQLDQLQSDVQKLEDVIAEKENTIHGHESVISSLNRRVDDLLPKAEAGMKYKDDLDEANHTIDKLKKGQNVAEKYRRKLEGMGELERQVKTLEQQHASILQDLHASQEHSKQVPSLKRIVEQYKKQIDKMETEYAELLRHRNALDVERNVLKEKVQGAESQKSRDMERIQYLEERVREMETGVIPQGSEHANGDLNSELTFSTKTKSDLKMQIARLEAELKNLKEGGGVNADNMMLQQLLDDATLAKNKLEQDFLVAHTDKLVLEAQLTAIRGGTSVEGSDVMLRLRQSLVDAEKQLSEYKLRCSEVEAELSATKRELVTAQSDLSLVDKDKLEILAELKTLVGAEVIELRQEHEEMRIKVRELEIDVEQKKSLLNTVLLEKDEISKKVSEQKDLMLEKEKSNSELKATIAAFTGSTEGRDGALEKRVMQLQNKLEDRREKMTKTREHIKKQNGIIKDLKEQLEQAITSTTDANVKAKEEQLAEFKRKKNEELAFLERENTLMATAWYDQASRLQMNSFVLQRMGDSPSSWLNKQRNAIHSSKKK
ncbi:uncharacterized protein H6S33_010287 [Morchella sextelata]|uniref:uncharacterized protein n=1 Tax=Morchella sextelata TaxID=1174677 RepID=UPI001D046C06|nr:uncharacterized protein H6S33_010287 [Morchella sextelata]KAH0612235.1 hypothetical protein H6S33_010287 [Morchella sextelata]